MCDERVCEFEVSRCETSEGRERAARAKAVHRATRAVRVEAWFERSRAAATVVREWCCAVARNRLPELDCRDLIAGELFFFF